MKKLIPEEVIGQKIFLLRGQKVMIHTHLAQLYAITTSALIQAVRRNIDRFPEDFMFALTRVEIRNLSQFVIGSKIKHAPSLYAFTEQGVAMLSSVLRSKRAIQVNIAIMRAFVRLREILLTHKELAVKIEVLELKYKNHDAKLSDHDAQIKDVFEAIRQLMTPTSMPEKPKIGFK